MEKARKKEIARQYRERERSQGVFVVRCAPSGEVWVSSTRNLDTQQNSVWFTLRLGGHPNAKVQAAWQAHGEGAFTYEIVEELDEGDHTPGGLKDLLKASERRWCEALGATALVG
jgi:hypothetical protein